MSDPTNNNHNKKLKDLLDHSKQPGQLPDDFEREALEGFALLDNKEEAMKLKEELDATLYPALRQRKNTGAYWLAAAGLVLIIGFSVFFVRTDVEKEHRLAVTDVKQTPVIPETQAETKAPQAQADNAEAPKKNNAGSEDHAAAKTDRNTAPLALAAKPAHAAKKEQAASEEAIVVAQAPPAQAAPPEITAQADAASPEIMKEKAAEAENDKLLRNENLAISPASPVQTGASQSSMAYNISQGAGSAKYEVQPMQLSQKAAKKSSTASVVAGPAHTTLSANYTGGEEALKKDLTEKLSASQLLQKFDAVLYIKADKTVESVKLTKSYDLTKKQQQQVKDILKTLNKFYYTGEPNKTPVAFNLEFRP